MYTATELAMLQLAEKGALLPGVDTPTGAVLTLSQMEGLPQLPVYGSNMSYYAGYFFDAQNNRVVVTKAGTVLNGINFGTATLEIEANNVTVNDCLFLSTSGSYSLQQDKGYSGATVTNCTFNGNQMPSALSAFITSRNSITITNNSFLNAPADAVDVGAGIISGNYWSGAGYTSNGQHPDAIWVSGSTGPTVITNNFIDWTTNQNSIYYTNDCIRITSELGSVSDVTVKGNYLIGGSTGIDAGNSGSGTFSNINISNNFLGFGVYNNFMPGPHTGVATTNNVIVDYSNPIFSTSAWAAYQTNETSVEQFLSATITASNVCASGYGSTMLYGGGVNGAHLQGGDGENIFVADAGMLYLWGGSGKNVFSFLSPSDSYIRTGGDSIGNFNTSRDVIDLHAMAQNMGASLSYIGSNAFTNQVGQIQVVKDTAHNQTLVEADVYGNGTAGFEVRLNGLLSLTAANFALTSSQYLADTSGYTTLSTFASSRSALDALAGGYSIVDTALNITNGLSTLQSDFTHINSVKATDATVSASIKMLGADRAILDKIVGGFSVVDTVADVQSGMSVLASDVANIKSISLNSDAGFGVISLTSTQATANAAVLAKISTPYVLQTFSSVQSSYGIDLHGHGNGLTISIGAGNSVVTGGGTGDTFVFASRFGNSTLTDFASHKTGTGHDIISLSTTDFSSWAALLADAKASGIGGVNTTVTASDGSSLTLVGVALSNLTSGLIKGDFSFRL